MVSMKKSVNKAAMRSQINQMQNQFKRFQRRCNVTRNPSEKRFLKTEARRIVTMLAQCSKQWKKCGFGPCKWITRNCKMSSFTTTKTTSRRPKSRRSKARRYGKRTHARRTHGRRSYARRHRRATTRRSYVAW